MDTDQIVFAQFMDLLPRHAFNRCVNALRTQIWIAVCVYVLITQLAKSQDQAPSTSEILKVLGIALFEKCH